ncbi:MAG: helix-turn-helix domain-containing protein, partial [Anaeromassilibacillus sp.]
IRADFLTLFGERAPRQGKRSVQEILDYVEEHCAEALTLNDVAKRFNFNYSYLSSYFSANSREGFSEYLNRARIRRAEELLRKGDIPVSEVCGMVGYGSIICKVFKKFTGKTPTILGNAAPRFGNVENLRKLNICC